VNGWIEGGHFKGNGFSVSAAHFKTAIEELRKSDEVSHAETRGRVNG
jgi:hypothetical protein